MSISWKISANPSSKYFLLLNVIFKKLVETQREYIESGVALFKNLQETLDSLKLEHREQKIENQRKLNVNQVEFIQSQVTSFMADIPFSQKFDFFTDRRSGSYDNH